MASVSSDNILQSIREQGYWVHDDPNIGKRVDGVLKPRINLQALEALELCKVAVFDNTVRTPTVPKWQRAKSEEVAKQRPCAYHLQRAGRSLL